MNTNVLQRIAAIHQAKINKRALKRQKKLAQAMKEKLAFEDTRILEIWDEVKTIEVKNFAPDEVDGVMVPLASFFNARSVTNIDGNGLELLDSANCSAYWRCNIEECGPEEMRGHIVYSVNTRLEHNTWHSKKVPDAKDKLVESFVTWLSKRITPDILINLGIDMTAQCDALELSKPKRKVSKIAE